jgi:diguanylate cyclase (GGDEF)-like protein
VTLKRVASAIGPEGLLFALVVALASWNRGERSVAELIRAAPYAVGLACLVLVWRLRRSRLFFALVVFSLAFALLARWAPRNPTLFQLVAVLLPLNLAAIALLPERGVLTRAGLLQSTLLLVELGLVIFVLRATGSVRLWPPLAHAFLPRTWSAWTRLDQPALIAFIVAGLALVAARWLAHASTGRGYLWCLAATFLALHARDVTLDRSLYFAAAAGVLLVATIELSYKLAYHDGLTGVPARRALTEALERLGGTYSIAMVDVDHFKRFNDTYGHEVGDDVLRTVAARLKEALPGGRVFRYGGEEFAVLFPGKPAEGCLPLLEGARETVAGVRFTVRRRVRPNKRPAKPRSRRSGRHETITVSMGLAQSGRRQGSADDVIRAADQALYRAKQGGRNRVETA